MFSWWMGNEKILNFGARMSSSLLRANIVSNNQSIAVNFSVALYSLDSSNPDYFSTSDILSVTSTTDHSLTQYVCWLCFIQRSVYVSTRYLFCLYSILYCVWIFMYFYDFCVFLTSIKFYKSSSSME